MGGVLFCVQLFQPQGYLEMPTTLRSVSRWFLDLKRGDQDAAQRLWDRYSSALIEQARNRLGDSPRRVADEEDIAQSVFHNLCRGATSGRFEDIDNRDELWWLLLAITKQKVIDQIRRDSAKKRGSGRVVTESSMKAPGNDLGFSLDYLIGETPSPEFLVTLQEQNQRLMMQLRNDTLRRIVVMRLEGYTVEEIAAQMPFGTRTVERKLQLIRSAWAEELSGVC